MALKAAHAETAGDIRFVSNRHHLCYISGEGYEDLSPIPKFSITRCSPCLAVAQKRPGGAGKSSHRSVIQCRNEPARWLRGLPIAILMKVVLDDVETARHRFDTADIAANHGKPMNQQYFRHT